MKKNVIFTLIAAACCLWYAVPSALGRSFTLSDDDLMSLDAYQNNDPNHDPNAPKIVSVRDVPGPGVEFDIYFPKDNKKNNSVEYVSCKNSGKGTLVDIDVNDFDAFALKFTLIAVDGKNNLNAGGMLVVGALMGGAYRPECISFSMGDEVISITSFSAPKISIIGFDVHKLTPNGWNPQGNTVTIRVEAAPNSEML
jgi:hypothetical protein